MHFMIQRMSSPIAYQASAGTALMTSATAMLQAIQQFRKASDLSSSWSGSSSQPHLQRIAQTIDSASRMVQAIQRANAISTSSGARMQALKTQNDATVASAMGAQFLVLPTGQVVPGPSHYASATGPHGPALMAMYWGIANAYTASINTNVAVTGASDVQTAATLATTVIQFVADLLGDNGNKPAPMAGMPDAPVAPGGWTLPPDDDPGTGLAGAGGGGLGGAGGIPGMGGTGGLGGIPGIPGGGTGLGGAPGIPGGGGIGPGVVGGGIPGRGGVPTGGMAGIGPGARPGGVTGAAGMGGRPGLGGTPGVIGATPGGGAAGGRPGVIGAGGGTGAAGRPGTAGSVGTGGRPGAGGTGARPGVIGAVPGAGTPGGKPGTAGTLGAGGAGRPGAAGGFGAGGAGGAGAAGSGAGGRGGAGGGMAAMGTTAAGRGSDEDDRPQADTWLRDDSDPFDPDTDAPGSVLG